MSQSNGKAPLIDRTQTASPSPARDALKANLTTDADSTLSLKKRKSWLGSIRDVFQKGALQAKAAVDSFRSDQEKPESYVFMTQSLKFITLLMSFSGEWRQMTLLTLNHDHGVPLTV